MLVSLYVALPVSPGSEEFDPSVSNSFSSSNGTPTTKIGIQKKLQLRISNQRLKEKENFLINAKFIM